MRKRVREALERLRYENTGRTAVRVGVVEETEQIVYQLRFKGLCHWTFNLRVDIGISSTGLVNFVFII